MSCGMMRRMVTLFIPGIELPFCCEVYPALVRASVSSFCLALSPCVQKMRGEEEVVPPRSL